MPSPTYKANRTGSQVRESAWDVQVPVCTWIWANWDKSLADSPYSGQSNWIPSPRKPLEIFGALLYGHLG